MYICLFGYSCFVKKLTRNWTTLFSPVSHRQFSFSSLELVGGMRETDARPFVPESVFPYCHISRNPNSPGTRSQAGIFNLGIWSWTQIRHRLSSLEHRERVQSRPARRQRGSTQENLSIGRSRKCPSSLRLGSSGRRTWFVTFHPDSFFWLFPWTSSNTEIVSKRMSTIIFPENLVLNWSFINCSCRFFFLVLKSANK